MLRALALLVLIAAALALLTGDPALAAAVAGPGACALGLTSDDRRQALALVLVGLALTAGAVVALHTGDEAGSVKLGAPPAGAPARESF